MEHEFGPRNPDAAGSSELVSTSELDTMFTNAFGATRVRAVPACFDPQFQVNPNKLEDFPESVWVEAHSKLTTERLNVPYDHDGANGEASGQSSYRLPSKGYQSHGG